MNEYKAMWQNFSNFNDRTNLRGYWMAILFNALAAFAVGIVVNITGLNILSTLYSLAVLVPGIAISVRRLNDTGKSWKFIFVNFIPVIGWIVFIVLACGASIEDNGVPTV